VRQVKGPGGATVPVPSPEHLAAMKIHAMASDPARKARELLDIRHLLALPDTDREAVRDHLLRRDMEEEWNELSEER